MEKWIKAGERLDDLMNKGLRIIQDTSAFRFSMDAVLLSHFATLKPGDKVVDLGCGSGVIPLLLSARQQVGEIIGVEIQPDIAERAQRSVALNELSHLIEIVTGDLRSVKTLLPGHRANLVTCNPPYIPVGQGEASPHASLAISRHELCCRLSDVAQAGAILLSTGGRLAMVHRPNRLVEIFAVFSGYSLEPKRMQLVLPYADREPSLVLVEFIKDGKPDLKVLPPLVVYEADGKHTQALLSIYYPEGRWQQ